MNFLVIGQGGREHAIIKALLQSPSIRSVQAIPGNSGIAEEIPCYVLDWKNFEQVYQFCIEHRIDVVVIGPEDPLVMGLSDYLRERKVLAVGPSKVAAQLEGSKVFAKEFMLEFGVATAKAETVRSVKDVQEKVSLFTPPYVLKADGLAAGKGVVLCQSVEQLLQTAHQFFEQKLFGASSEKALLEQFLPGYELSLLLITNGSSYQLFPLAQDHKQLFDGDKGPNTGGMGTVAPLFISQELQEQIKIKIIEPTLMGLKSRNMFYRGVLFLGLMITNEGPQLLEYNCRFGDPETQVIMPLLDGDWGQLFYQIAIGEIPELHWKKLFTSCVVMAAPGYPDHPQKGVNIEGAIQDNNAQSYFIHSGTKKTEEGQWKTAGGRVLCAMGIADSKEKSLQLAYSQAQKIKWQGMQMRSDIGRRPNLANDIHP